MKSYFVKTPTLLKKIYHKRLWDIKNSEEKTVYLTFDDGPTPGVTPWVLEQLKQYNAKATFFCIGKNIKQHPQLFQRLFKEGHSIGNHTNNHMEGWKTPLEKYLKNIQKAEKHILNNLPENDKEIFKNKKLFRPPYGKMTSKQAKEVLKQGYEIVMWDVISADFDQTISTEKCTQNVLKNSKSGSIIIFHDSLKAETNLKIALPATLKFLKSKNYRFKAIGNGT